LKQTIARENHHHQTMTLVHSDEATLKRINRSISRNSWNHHSISAIYNDVTLSRNNVEKFREEDLCTLKLLGSGSFSNVFLAYDKSNSDEIFAVKRLKPSVRICSETLTFCATDLAIETTILMNLNHENIISLRGTQEGNMIQLLKDGTFFIAIDPLGETLKDRMKRWRKKWTLRRFTGGNIDTTRRLRGVALGIVKGMEYLHSKRVIHRDLKPANIGFDMFSDEIKIFDFGLARVGLSHEGTSSNVSLCDQSIHSMTKKIGTPKYMAPEVAHGDTNYGFSVDVYSFSILFWQLVTNRVAFENMDSTSELGIRIADKIMRPSLKCIKLNSLKELIKACWSNKPDDRPTFSMIRKWLEYIIENPSSMNNIDKPRRHRNSVRSASSNISNNIDNSMRPPQQIRRYRSVGSVSSTISNNIDNNLRPPQQLRRYRSVGSVSSTISNNIDNKPRRPQQLKRYRSVGSVSSTISNNIDNNPRRPQQPRRHAFPGLLT